MVVVRFLPFVQIAENYLYDIRLTLLSKPKQQSTEIVVIGITEETLSTMPYRSPVDRAFLSQLVIDLESKAAAAIAFDILFDQPTEEIKDQLLRDTLKSAKIPIILANAYLQDKLLPKQIEYLRAFTKPHSKGYAAIYRNSLDGVIRTFPLRISNAGITEFGLVAQIAKAMGISIPDSETLHIDYQLGPDSKTSRFAVYPAHTAKYLPRAWIENKVVLIGAVLEQEDRHTTPLSRVLVMSQGTAGVLIHAQALAQLFEQSELRVTHIGWTIWVALMLALLGLVIAASQRQISTRCLLILGLAIGFWAVACLIFAFSRVMIEILPATIALILSSLAAIVQQWKGEIENRKFIQSAFSKYLSPGYVAQLVENPELLQVGGERREMTFLFTDLAGFTPLTEALEPEVLVSLVNEYLDGTCEIVTRHGGMVASIIGDALYVIFNAPVLQDNHAQMAVDAALELDLFCLEFQRLKSAQGIPLDITRIGINTGFGVIGNYGGSRRLEYTAMGDGINTAARLESVNKHLGTRICVSESAASRCEGITFRPVGRIILKGKSEGVKTFEPGDSAATGSAEFAAYQSAFQKMAEHRADALEDFIKLAKNHPDDALVAFHLQRLRNGDTGELIVMEEK